MRDVGDAAVRVRGGDGAERGERRAERRRRLGGGADLGVRARRWGRGGDVWATVVDWNVVVRVAAEKRAGRPGERFARAVVERHSRRRFERDFNAERVRVRFGRVSLDRMDGESIDRHARAL